MRIVLEYISAGIVIIVVYFILKGSIVKKYEEKLHDITDRYDEKIKNLEESYVIKFKAVFERLKKLENIPGGETLSDEKPQEESPPEKAQMEKPELASPSTDPDSEKSTHNIETENIGAKDIPEPPIATPREETEEDSDQFVIFSTIAEALVSPFAAFFSYFKKTYNHYKSEEKLAIFFLTLFGITTSVIGFGFILKLSFDHFFGPLAKVGTGFLAAAAILYTGKQLFEKESYLREYASSLIGLAIILNYLNIYFLSSYYGKVGPVAGFILIIANTVIATFLSLKYETKIVSVITLFGGALAPFYLDSGDSPIFYFLFLFILNISIIYTAKKIEWPVLKNLSFLLSAIILELFIFTGEGSHEQVTVTIIVHAIAYLFIYFSLFNGIAIKKLLGYEDLGIIAGSVTLLLLNLFVTFDDYLLLGTIYILNAVPFIFMAISKKFSRDNRFKTLFITISSIFVGFAFFSYLDNNLMGAFWGQEALFLIFIGFLFNLQLIRKEGYLFLIVAITKMAFSLPTIANEWKESILSDGFINIVITVLLLLLLKYIFIKFKDRKEKFEIEIESIIDEIIPLSLFVIYTITMLFFLQDFYLILILIPMLALIYYGGKKSLIVTQVAGMALYLLILLQIFISIQEVDSIRFFAQTIFGKIAIIEALLLLWFFQLFYEKLLPDNRFTGNMQKLRELFYLIVPLTVLSPVRRHFPEYLPLAVWFSTVISFFLWEFIKKKSLLIEFYLLCFVPLFFSFSLWFTKLESRTFPYIYFLAVSIGSVFL